MWISPHTTHPRGLISREPTQVTNQSKYSYDKVEGELGGRGESGGGGGGGGVF